VWNRRRSMSLTSGSMRAGSWRRCPTRSAPAPIISRTTVTRFQPATPARSLAFVFTSTAIWPRQAPASSETHPMCITAYTVRLAISAAHRCPSG
jgi:hypothetical protein